jgi:hypothetical protein
MKALFKFPNIRWTRQLKLLHIVHFLEQALKIIFSEQHNGYGGQKPLPQSPRSSNDQRFNGVADQRYPPPVANGGSGHGDPLLYPGEGMEPPSLQSISSDFSSHNSQKVL